MPSSKYTGIIVGGSSQGINVICTSILKVGSLISFVRCCRRINYMLCFLFMCTHIILIVFVSIIITLFLLIYNTYMFNIYPYHNYFNI